MNYKEQEVRQLAMHDVVLHNVVSLYDHGRATWEQAMTEAALHLARTHDAIIQQAVNSEMVKPVRFEIEGEPANRFFNGLADRFWRDASPELQAAMVAGCELEYSSKVTTDGIKMTVSTKNPVAVIHDGDNVTVYEKKQL